jgi:hypothetical protein
MGKMSQASEVLKNKGHEMLFVLRSLSVYSISFVTLM